MTMEPVQSITERTNTDDARFIASFLEGNETILEIKCYLCSQKLQTTEITSNFALGLPTKKHKMFTHISLDIILLLMLYAMGATVSAVACLYLLFRRGNAFTQRLTTPQRLRRWTAAFFGIVALGHFWYLPAGIMADSEAAMLWMLIGGLLDCLLTIPGAIIVLLCMLQDRRRPLWPVAVITAPLVIIVLVSIAMRSYALLPWLRGYFALMGIALVVYMVREVRQYGRWLRDNFADLEHKEVWQSFVVLAVVVLMFAIYASGNGGMVYEYVVQVCGIAMICYLLWRVETLSELTPDTQQTHPRPLPVRERTGESLNLDDIKPLLQQHCEATQLYLRHELTLSQLAQALGTNRTYLSQYFSRQDTTYNAYINTLRIAHFERLFREAVAAGRDVTAQELSTRSGYRSYRTFSQAFKQRKGKSVKEWMSTEGA